MSNRPYFLSEESDGLSALIGRLQLKADIYVDGDFCGTWAMDTSGSRRIPFHLIGKGQAWLQLDDAFPRRLGPGDLVIFPRDKKHIISGQSSPVNHELLNVMPVLIPDEPITNMICGFFEFDNPIIWPILDSLDDVILLDLTECSRAPQIKIYIDLMLGELQRRNPGFIAAINQIAYLLFMEVLRHQIASEKVNAGLLSALFDKKINRALGAIHNNPEYPWSLEDLARHAAMGRSSFAKKFNELVGIPAMQYLTQWRMQIAKQLLETTLLSIGDIAGKCGYESEFAFRKAFKKSVGINAAQFRREPR
jgi:AraC family transcriptional regulator, activator of mtrCDE